MNNVTKFTNYSATAVVVLGLVFMGVLLVARFWDFKILETNHPWETSHSEYYPGQLVEYVIEYCKFTDASPDIHHELVCDNRHRSIPNDALTIHDEGLNVEKGCGTLIKGVYLPVMLPDNWALPMTCRVRETLVYQVNPIRTMRVSMETKPFQLIGNGEMRWQDKKRLFMKYAEDWTPDY